MLHEKRKAAGPATDGQTVAGLKPWREVIVPHADVAVRRVLATAKRPQAVSLRAGRGEEGRGAQASRPCGREDCGSADST